jgi:hypothetical protein
MNHYNSYAIIAVKEIDRIVRVKGYKFVGDRLVKIPRTRRVGSSDGGG